MDPTEELIDIIYNQKALKEVYIGTLDTDSYLVYLNGQNIKEFEITLKSIKAKIINKISPKIENPAYVIEQLQNAKEDFFEFEINGETHIFQNGLTFYHIDQDGVPFYTIQYVLNRTKEFKGIAEQFHLFSEVKYEYLNEIIELLQNLNSSIKTTMKLNTKLSVSELSLLFRLLNEEGVLELKNNAELYRFISSSFSTKQSENISDKSIKNKFLSPDNTAVKNMDILLVNLRQQLKKIQ